DTLAPQTASPYVIDFKFTHSIPLDDLVIFSAFFEYPNNLDNIFEACDEYEDSLATPRASKTRRYNPVSNYASFFITIQCERNSNGELTFDGLNSKNQNTSIELKGHPIFAGVVDIYYNVDINGKHPPPPILFTVHDTFWLFSPANGGSCIYDTTHSFDQVIGQITA
ncbi:MAG: hypothetical protein EZS28_030926, partial [Streblomastix strix]